MDSLENRCLGVLFLIVASRYGIFWDLVLKSIFSEVIISRLPTKFSKRSHLLLFDSKVSCLNQAHKMLLCKFFFWQLFGCWQACSACDMQADIQYSNIKWRSFHWFRKRLTMTPFLHNVFILLTCDFCSKGSGFDLVLLIISPYVHYHCICNTNLIFQIKFFTTKLLWYLCPWHFFITYLNSELLSIADFL